MQYSDDNHYSDGFLLVRRPTAQQFYFKKTRQQFLELPAKILDLPLSRNE